MKSAASVRLADLIDACCQVTNGQMKPRRGWKAVLAVLQRYHNAPLLEDRQRAGDADTSKAVGEDSCDQDDKVVTIADLLRAMMEAPRRPSQSWFGNGMSFACQSGPSTFFPLLKDMLVHT